MIVDGWQFPGHGCWILRGDSRKLASSLLGGLKLDKEVAESVPYDSRMQQVGYRYASDLLSCACNLFDRVRR